MAGNEVILLEEDLIKNLAKTEQPAGGGGGGGAYATKLRSRIFSDFKSKIHQLENEEKAPSSNLKIQCPNVPWRLRYVRDAEDYYVPKVVSFGPYHHGRPDLQEGETLKLKLAATYFREYELLEDEIYYRICNDIEVLRECYNRERTEKYTDEELSVMLLVDGCALLSYILCVCIGGYFCNEVYDIRYQDLSRIQQDALLLENQLPYQLLHDLMPTFFNGAWTVIFQEFFGMTDESFFKELIFGTEEEESLLRKMKNYCCRLFLFLRIINPNPKPKPEKYQLKPCRHLLDLYRTNILGDELSESKIVKNRPRLRASFVDLKERMATVRNVRELMATGIRIMPSPTRCLRDISFTSNVITPCLRLPPITIDNSTYTLFLNLIAYEMSSDVPLDFISYLSFLNSLIDHADDVKELQSAGVLQNNLGTHEQVVEFFKTLSFNLDQSDFNAYKDVRVKIRKHLNSHYNSRLKLWMRQCLDTYFSSPWTIIAWVGVTLALFFTAVQTYFAVFHP